MRILSAVAAVALLVLPDSTVAFEKYVAKIPNGGAVPGIKALGHVNHKQGGGARNQFGRAFQKAKYMWTPELCQEDTDGDGQTNGQELGDPCCSWYETGNLAYISGISDPGDPTSMANPLIFKNIQCTKSEEAVEEQEKQSKKLNKAKKAKKTKKPSPSEDDGEDDELASSNSTDDSGVAGSTRRPVVRSDARSQFGCVSMAIVGAVATTVALVL